VWLTSKCIFSQKLEALAKIVWMVQLHIILSCIFVGMSLVDILFDSPNLLHNCREEDLARSQAYYGWTRSTFIVPLIHIMLALTGISLVRSVIYRQQRRDYLALLAVLLLVPYFVIFMEPAENAFLSGNVGDSEACKNIQYIFWGHVLVIAVSSLLAFLELGWSFPEGKVKRT